MQHRLPRILIIVPAILSLLSVCSSAVPFTIDGSTIFVNAGYVGIRTSTPTTVLDVNGDAQFGAGATKSTFTSTGLLNLAPAGIQWADGTVSTTAMSGGGSSASSTVEANLDTMAWSNGATLTGVCVTGSTITITGSEFDVRFSGSVCDNAGCNGAAAFQIGYLIDGAYPSGQTSTRGTTSAITAGATFGGANLSFTKSESLSSGSHSFCLRLVNFNLSGISNCTNTPRNLCRFSVRKFH